MPDLAECKLCGVAKPDEAFPARPDGRRNGRQCRECLNTRSKERWRTDRFHRERAQRRQKDRYWSNPEVRERSIQMNRLRHLKVKHGMTGEQYDEFCTRFGNRCAVCGDTENLHIDHSHDCCPHGFSCEKCRRGLLCVNCNVALGMLQDDPDRIRNLLAYLMVLL